MRVDKHEKARPDAVEYISDGAGNVRIMATRPRSSTGGYDKGGTRYSFRRKDAKNWQPLNQTDGHDDGFDPYAVDSTLDVAYGLKRLDGRLAAYTKALDGTGTETLIYAHPQVDVDDFIRIGRNGRVIGVSYATDKREAHYFDPTLAKLALGLSKALPATPLIRFLDSSQDESRILIWAGSDNNPGSYYLFDKATKHLEPVAVSRPELANIPLASVRAVSYPAADGAMVPGYLTLPPGVPAKGLPTLVMPHGGPAARDEWGFDWLAQYFANQGYAVLQPNFRGSSGYGDQWFQKNGFRNWRAAISDIDDGGRWLAAQGIADPKRMAIFGWSYGGYAALQSAVVDPGLFKAVVAVAPVTDLDRLKEEHRQWSDFVTVSNYVGTGPHIDAGSPARHAREIKVPVMLFHGTLDRNVGVGESRLMDSRLKDAGASSTLVIYDGLDHYLDDGDARADMLSKSAAFLARILKP